MRIQTTAETGAEDLGKGDSGPDREMSQRRYTKAPERYLKSRFWNFILPATEQISAKLVFDNVRNYGIAAGVVAAGQIYRVNGGEPWAVIALGVTGCVLVLTASAQTFLIGLRAFYEYVGLSHDELVALEQESEQPIGMFKAGILLALLFIPPILAFRLIAALLR